MPLSGDAPIEAYLHIGTHKTGTVAFQKWAEGSCDQLKSGTGIDYYEGLYGPNHFEIPMLCLRPERGMPKRSQIPEWETPAWQEATAAHVRSQVERPPHRLLISAEALSYVRFPDEVARVAELLAPRDLYIVTVLREPASYLASYRAMMTRAGAVPSDDPTSFRYIEPDSWLVDYEALIRPWADVLGPDRVSTVSYEAAMDRYGSTVPAIMIAFGCDADALPAWQGFFRNVTPAQRPSLVRNLARVRSTIRRVNRQRGGA